MGMLGHYAEPIFGAILVFPLIAALFTVPFIIVNYRKFGGIAVMRVMIVYSFILYSMCTFLLTVLPLPDPAEVARMAPHPIGWIPYRSLHKAMLESGLSLANPSSLADLGAWKRFLTCSDMFQVLANIAMLVPLGFYLRYYFRLSFKKTVLIGFCASLFFELTQLSGLYGIYPQPYRFTEMDDLINNTLGAALGYGLTPLVAAFLPTRDEIDRLSYLKGGRITLSRKLFALFIDAVLFGVLSFGVFFLPVIPEGIYRPLTVAMLFVLYFGVLPVLIGGRTLGQATLKLRTRDESKTALATFTQLLLRNLLLFCIEPMALFLCFELALALISVLFWAETELWLRVVGAVLSLVPIIAVFATFMYVQREYDVFPHAHFSHTVVIADNDWEPDDLPDQDRATGKHLKRQAILK